MRQFRQTCDIPPRFRSDPRDMMGSGLSEDASNNKIGIVAAGVKFPAAKYALSGEIAKAETIPGLKMNISINFT